MKVTEILIESRMGELHSEFADVYHKLAPKIQRHKDAASAEQLYQALKAVAVENNAVAIFKNMLNAARNAAHMDYDTNPGGFENWFWYLPFDDDDLSEGSSDIRKKISKFEELALAANRAGDDEKCKFYQQKIQTLKQKMSQGVSEAKARYEMTDLDPWTFDQTPAGWRGLPSSARQADALNQYIDRYVKDGQFVGAPQGVKTVKPYILYWHLGQVLTQMGRNAMASRVMRQALDDSDPNWNAYVMATISFLRKDRKDFDHWAPLARGNEETIKRLTNGWGRPYKQAYAGQQGVAEGIDPYRLERLDPQTRRVLIRMGDHKEPGSWLSASEAYALTLGLQHKNRDPRGWEQEVQHFVDLYRQYSGQGVAEGVLTDIRYAWVRILTGLADKVISLANSGELNAKQRDAIAHGTKELEQKLLAKISGHPREQQLRPYVDYIVKQVGQQTNFSDFSKTLYQMAKQFKPELGKFSEGIREGLEPTEQTMNQNISDLVKDAMGARPNSDWMQRWMAMSVDKKLALYQQLVNQLD